MTHRSLVLVVLFAVACGAEADPAPVGTAPGAATAGPYCTRDEQCEVGFWCEGGECLDANGTNQADGHPCDAVDDPDHDLYHCGACGVRCPWGSAGVVWCDAGVCGTTAGTPNG